MTPCLICGAQVTIDRPWCSKQCRLLLREEARARFGGLSDADALRAAVRWAQEQRHAQPRGPLTPRLARRLASIPKRTTVEATAASRSVAAERSRHQHEATAASDLESQASRSDLQARFLRALYRTVNTTGVQP